jgi:hypothetical protein
MTVSVLIGTSVDGFIARPNGDLDFLPDSSGEPHGYIEFIAGVDAIVIGRKTGVVPSGSSIGYSVTHGLQTVFGEQL